MKNPLRALFLPLVAFMLLTSSACDNAADTSKNTLLSTGAKIGKDAMQGSMAEFTKAIKLDPKSAKAYAGRGALKYAMGDSKGAILDLTKSIELNPKSVSAYSGRGSAKFATGDTPGAIADFISAGRLMLFPTSGSESGNESGSDAGKESGNESGKDSDK
jgi:tetratricopeptide (TPR) repeat protein